MKPKLVFGDFFKKKRIEKGLTLRSFCLINGFDPGNISKLERGLLAPPNSRDKLEEYAKALNLKPGSEDWVEFFDRAAACKGEIPLEIMSDAKLVQKLPLIFRTIRGTKVTDKQLGELAELIRKS
jgi:transcriptional regulator with XRE-family HTH domain